MSGHELVRPSRDGDQFHYHWAARQCLKLLPGQTDLVAITIEGASAKEDESDEIEAGEQLIDVGLYFGAESLHKARLIRYIQLKHSTRAANEPWTASGLKKTIKGFAERYVQLVERFNDADVIQRFRFEFITNRPIETKVREALADLASGNAAQHPNLHKVLIEYAGIDKTQAAQFFKLFFTKGGEGALWEQRHLLAYDISAYLPDADYDAPIQLKDLITRKATTEFESDPSIHRHDVLRALKASEEQLQPAPCLISDQAGTLPREQEQEILQALLAAEHPIVIHADGGVGKSVLAARLVASMPIGSEAVLYDCFGDGLYRSSINFRHRHRDALVQIANELAAQGLCHPLIPTAYADTKQYMRAFLHRLKQAVELLRASAPEALLCLIIDAADNAEMAAEEQGEPSSFVRDLIRIPLPDGIRLAFTCRTHRRSRLGASPEAHEIELRPFSENESAHHLRRFYPAATGHDVAEFAILSSSNPRVQALVISQGLPLQEMLRRLGPEPTTVDRTIGELLEVEVARLRDLEGSVEASQIDVICQGLAILRPLVPVTVLAKLSQTSESAVRSFALGLSRPLLVKGDSLHFRDEPSETWFRERFKPDATALTHFLECLRPLAAQSSYAAAMLPQLLLEAGRMDELVELALSGERLPTVNPLEKRDVELQRLTFALKACLQQRRYVAAAKLALKCGAECAGEQRQNNLIQENTDLVAQLMAPDRIEEIVSRRVFSSGWMGSRHAYDAGLLSGRDEFSAVAFSRLRMAMDWLEAWARLPQEEREQENVSHEDRVELTLAILRLRGGEAAAQFVRRWRPRHFAFDVGRRLGRRLIDLGQYEQLNVLAESSGNDVWLLLGLISESSVVGHRITTKPLMRLLRLLGDRRVKLHEYQEWNEKWTVLYAVRSAVELALRVLPPEPSVWVAIIQRYLPPEPPADLASRFGFDRAPMLRAYALEAALRGERLALIDVAPSEVREQLDSRNQYGRSRDADIFQQEVGGLLPWVVLSAEIICDRFPSDWSIAIAEALNQSNASASRMYRQDQSLRQAVALEWLRLLRDAGVAKAPELESFKSWLSQQKDPLWPDTLIALCRMAARAEGVESLALDFAAEAYQALEAVREDAESRAESYLKLARAILAVSLAEAGVFFDRAVDIASRIGDENLHRWAAFLHLAKAAGEHNNPRPRTAYRLSRVAELTYEYVTRDKHFDWDGTAEALTDLCASSALSILSQWRDRRFGDPERLLPLVIYRLMAQGSLPVITPIAFGGIEAGWDRLSDLKRVVAEEVDSVRRYVSAHISYRYIRVQPLRCETLLELSELSKTYDLKFPDIHRLLAATHNGDSTNEKDISKPCHSPVAKERRSPDWDTIFQGIDLADADSLQSAYAAISTYDPPYEFNAFFQEAFARVRIGREPELVHAIAASPDFGIFKLRYLLDTILSQPLKQLSFQKAVRDAVLSVCRREPERVQRRGWGVLIPFEKLHKDGLVADQDVVQATLEGFALQVDVLSAGDFFQLVDPLASCLSPEQADEALNFGMDLLEDMLRLEDGNGPWRTELQPPQSLISSLAGYIWVGLGSPIVSERWQCAHVVRSMVELDWAEFLKVLIDWANTDVPLPFIDQELPFYVWHARQWLLIGLARGGLENASALRSSVPFLRFWLREEHVLIRELASQALRTLMVAGELDANEFDDLDTVNWPILPEKVFNGWLDPIEDKAFKVDEALSDDEKYYFGMDIGPYWFAPLGRAFGLSQEAIERRARHALGEHMGWNGGSRWQEDSRLLRRIFGDRETSHAHGSMPTTDDLCAYHGYHAMMLVAAALLKEQPVRRQADESIDEFRDWLSSYLLTRADGKWLADQRDPRLVKEPPSPEGYNDKLWCWSVTADYLDQMLVTEDSMTVLKGHWNGGEDGYYETVSVGSALTSRVGAEALVAALQTAPELGHFTLPNARFSEDMEAGILKLKAWVTDESDPARLDEGDPWAKSLHFPGPRPSDDEIKKMGLVASEDGRTWRSGIECLLRSETWTRTQGYGQEMETIPGWRLSGNRGFLKRLLNAHPDYCLILSVEIRRRPPRHDRGNDEFGRYPQPYARYYLMEEDGVPHAL
ncbi:NACHT domain-containing protein [Vreelandella sedimenti]|uniref:NACHT domain-containing protein n=1 Tax=Vreelandella sedimenti TaxID=2729618 RepID=UPI00257A24E9|nr:NACHT domain-containing protein [Halomonas sp. UBA3173]|tara:strand:- start:17259 stop:23519 length:6261 start_codon:yes stop_codon:yes gene_type:complete